MSAGTAELARHGVDLGEVGIGAAQEPLPRDAVGQPQEQLRRMARRLIEEDMGPHGVGREGRGGDVGRDSMDRDFLAIYPGPGLEVVNAHLISLDALRIGQSGLRVG